MKYSQLSFIVFSLALPLVLSQQSIAQGLATKSVEGTKPVAKKSEKNPFKQQDLSGTEGHGGNIDPQRAIEIEKYISNSKGLRADLRAYFKNVRPSDIEAQAASLMVQQMIDASVDADIQLSPYSPKDTCIDEKGDEQTATTAQDVAAAEICFNITMLAKRNAKRWEIVGLAAHEHSRHLKLHDEDPYMLLASVVSQTGSDFSKPSNLTLSSPPYQGNLSLKNYISSKIYMLVESLSDDPRCSEVKIAQDTFGTPDWSLFRDLQVGELTPLTVTKPVLMLGTYVGCPVSYKIYDQGKRVISFGNFTRMDPQAYGSDTRMLFNFYY